MQFDTEYKYFNNGFNCRSESPDEYSSRLTHLAAKLSLIVEIEKPSFICLQECPETQDNRDKFARKIKVNEEVSHYKINYMNNDSDEYYLMTLYDERNFSISQDLSAAIAAVPLSEGLVGRILPLVFLNKTQDEATLVVNVHAKFPNDIQSDVKALYQAAIELGIKHVVFLGDFNRDLVQESDNYSKHDIAQALDARGCFAKDLHVNAISGASFCSTYNKETEQGGQKIETRDGIMSTFPVEVVCMANVNAAVLSHSLSSDLRLIPKGFLERLEVREESGLSVSMGN